MENVEELWEIIVFVYWISMILNKFPQFSLKDQNPL